MSQLSIKQRISLQKSLETVDRMCKYLAIGILNIYNMLDPDIIALGGGVSESENFPIEQVKKKVNEMVFSKDVRYGEIVPASLGNSAGIIGSAFLGYYNNDGKSFESECRRELR